jgi:hypothetical protein
MEDEDKTKVDKGMKLRELTRVMGPVEAEVLKNFLESQGIRCVLRGQMAPTVYPFSVDGMGEIKVLVSEADYPLAKELLAERPPVETE